MQITFEELPTAVMRLQEKLDNVERLLIESTGDKTRSSSEDLLTVEGCAKFLKLSKPTIYGLISKGEIPFMKRSKRIYFSRQELMDYLKEGRKKSNSEIRSEVVRITGTARDKQ